MAISLVFLGAVGVIIGITGAVTEEEDIIVLEEAVRVGVGVIDFELYSMFVLNLGLGCLGKVTVVEVTSNGGGIGVRSVLLVLEAFALVFLTFRTG
jgi:hypothetical protein